MGNAAPGQHNKSLSQTINETITDITINDVQQCPTMVSQEQGLNISGSSGISIENLRLLQSAMISTTCYQDAQRVNNLQAQAANQINQKLKNSGPAVLNLFNNQTNEMESYVRNQVRNNISATTIQNCAATANQAQTIKISGSTNVNLKDISFEQSLNLMRSCMSSTLNNNNAFSRFDNVVDQQAENKSTNPIAEIIDGFAKLFSAPVLIIGALIVGFLVLILIVYVVSRLAAPGQPSQLSPPGPIASLSSPINIESLEKALT